MTISYKTVIVSATRKKSPPHLYLMPIQGQLLWSQQGGRYLVRGIASARCYDLAWSRTMKMVYCPRAILLSAGIVKLQNGKVEITQPQLLSTSFLRRIYNGTLERGHHTFSTHYITTKFQNRFGFSIKLFELQLFCTFIHFGCLKKFSTSISYSKEKERRGNQIILITRPKHISSPVRCC